MEAVNFLFALMLNLLFSLSHFMISLNKRDSFNNKTAIRFLLLFMRVVRSRLELIQNLVKMTAEP